MSVPRSAPLRARGSRAVFFALVLSLLCGLFPGSRIVPSVAKSSGTAIGIDLGTTYSCAAVYRGNKVDIIHNDLGERTTPSQVGYTTKNDVIVGSGANYMLSIDPRSVIFDSKRLIGRNLSDQSIKDHIDRWPFKVSEENDKLLVNVKPLNEEKVYKVTPEEISAKVLGKMRAIAEEFLGEEVRDAVVTVPAYFNDLQRRLTMDAASIAGLNVIRIINEPTAAAIAYGLNKKPTSPDKPTRILVYDLGGGTFDVSILEFQDGIFDVKATGGNTHLGGQDFNKNLVDYVFGEWSKTQKVPVPQSKISVKSMSNLYLEAEKAKRILSTAYNAKIFVENFYNGEPLDISVTRAKFNSVNEKLFNGTIDVVNEVMKEKSYSISDIDDIVLVGGSTRIPMIVKLVTDKFKKPPKKDIDPDEAVAHGAAIQAAILSGEKGDGVDQMILVDITSLNLGIEVQGGLFSTIIPKNSPKPIVKSQTFTTVSDNQSSVIIKVYEGQRPMAKDNFELGKFELTGILSAPRGTPQIEVSFKINADGILEVTASDKATGSTTTKVVRDDSRSLTPEQIEALIKEAEENADKDKIAKESAIARNELESFLYGMKALKANAEKNGTIDSGDLAELTKGIEDLEKWFGENSATLTKQQVEEKMSSLNEISTKVSSALYAAAGAGAGAGAGSPEMPPPSFGTAGGGDDLAGGDI